MDVDMESPYTKPALESPTPPTTAPDATHDPDDLSTGRVTCSSIFSRSHKRQGEPLFFQMPDTLPGLPIAEEEEEKEDKKPSVSGGNVDKPHTSSKKVIKNHFRHKSWNSVIRVFFFSLM